MRELSLDNCRLDKRYDIQRHLGRGSYAEIYLARDILASPSSAHNEVVIKALNVFLQDDLDPDLERTLVENFQNEAVALDRVRHPNIVSRLGHGTARDLSGTVFHYLVLEYLSGGDLQKIIKQETLSPKRAFGFLEQVCAGLRHAHKRGVIHRDIKPQNLLLAGDLETVKITDFGVARFSHADSPITRVGTNVYAPPEHSPVFYNGDGVMTVARLTPAADIYSLAKSTYTLLTGESPRFYVNQPITQLPAESRNEEWSDELRRVLQKATQDDPSARPQSVDEFWDELAVVRDILDENDAPTAIRSSLSDTPQAHVAPGYSPIAPMQPRFNTSRDLRRRFPAIAEDPKRTAATGVSYALGEPAESTGTGVRIDGLPAASEQGNRIEFEIPNAYVPRPRKSFGFLGKIAAFIVFIGLFGGLLYGTHAYLKNAGFLPGGGTQTKTQNAVANTDIFLRPSPSANNDPLGVVTKNSRVKIVNSQNNWYQVDVVEQGRPVANQGSLARGWLNGKYLDID
ncbi:MAG: serine/threonine protein kinase [Acidobacteriota bacterium]